jgi:hypothetical protein
MALSLSGEDPRGPRGAATGSGGTPGTPRVSSPVGHVRPARITGALRERGGRRPVLQARQVLGWPKICKLAHAFLWELAPLEKAEVGPTSGPIRGVFLTWSGVPPTESEIRPIGTYDTFGAFGPALP